MSKRPSVPGTKKVDPYSVPVTFVWSPDGEDVLRTDVSAAAAVEHGLPPHVKVIGVFDVFPPADADEAWFLNYLAEGRATRFLSV